MAIKLRHTQYLYEIVLFVATWSYATDNQPAQLFWDGFSSVKYNLVFLGDQGVSGRSLIEWEIFL